MPLHRASRVSALAALLLVTAPLHADDARLLATGGASQIEGAAGGGLVPWAVLTGYGGEKSQSGSAFVTRVDTTDYGLSAVGAAFSWRNRVEISFARQAFDLGTLGSATLPAALAVPATTFDDSVLRQNIFGAKVRVAGDVVYGNLPQLSLGLQHKQLDDDFIPVFVGAKRDSDTDLYLSATKVFLAGALGHNLLVNGTLRATRANEMGLLGFGGPLNDDHELQFETSLALLTDERTAIGWEYRQKPRNLNAVGMKESDWQDVFIAYFPSKQVSFVLAWANLREIATLKDQEGFYLSAQAAF